MNRPLKFYASTVCTALLLSAFMTEIKTYKCLQLLLPSYFRTKNISPLEVVRTDGHIAAPTALSSLHLSGSVLSGYAIHLQTETDHLLRALQIDIMHAVCELLKKFQIGSAIGRILTFSALLPRHLSG